MFPGHAERHTRTNAVVDLQLEMAFEHGRQIAFRSFGGKDANQP
jgi:hypothetical protein